MPVALVPECHSNFCKASIVEPSFENLKSLDFLTHSESNDTQVLTYASKLSENQEIIIS